MPCRWNGGLRFRGRRTPLSPVMARISVIGAGLIGLSCAWRLAQAGHRVALFDVSAAPREASWAAAGMLAPHHEADAATPLWRLCSAGLERWPGYLADLGLAPADADWQAGGGWIRAATIDELDRLESSLRWLRTAGIDVLRLSPAAYARACPGAAPGVGALWLPGAQVDPRRVLGPLRQACQRAGVEDRGGVAVSGLDGTRTLTADGRIHEADQVLLATGAWTPAMAALLGVRLGGAPVKGQMVRLAGPVHLPGYVREGHRYLISRRDGSVVVGATMVEQGFDRSDDPAAARALADWAGAAVPALAAAAISETWTGLRPRLAGGMPAICRLRPGLLLATGHFRNGILLAPITAEAVADLAADRSPDETVLAFDAPCGVA